MIAHVPFEKIQLVDYDFIPGHEYTASLFQTSSLTSWTGEVFSGAKCVLSGPRILLHCYEYCSSYWPVQIVSCVELTGMLLAEGAHVGSSASTRTISSTSWPRSFSSRRSPPESGACGLTTPPQPTY